MPAPVVVVVTQATPPVSRIDVTGTQVGNVALVQVRLPGVQGPEGAQGTPGLNGQSSAFIYEQAQPSAQWVIDHDLNAYPGVTLVDTAGDQFAADVQYASTNTVIVTMNAPTSGTAYLN